MNKCVWRIRQMIMRKENESTQEENLSQFHFVHHKSHID